MTPSSDSATAQPIFVVGSPRSGTSILTWCLGQHSNILVQEESSWIGPLAVQMEIAYRVGTARGERSQLSALGVSRKHYFGAFGEAINRLVLTHRENLEKRSRGQAGAAQDRPFSHQPVSAAEEFKITRDDSDPKGRWVDGTPEYSFYIYPLFLLFPKARFIHLVRDVAAVVRSMLNFERTGGPPLVANEQAAYDYWLRTVRACLAAEQAFGSNVVCRLRHSDLLEQPERSLTRILNFLSEPFETSCLGPLRTRINSSAVPSDFDPSSPKTDPAVVERARELNYEILQLPTHLEPDAGAHAELEKGFSERADELARRAAQPK
jgi:Sulfotransferase family